MTSISRTAREPREAAISVKVAVYGRSAEPEVSEVSASGPSAAGTKLTRFIMRQVEEAGGKAPEVAVREIVDNLVHAEYRSVVISVFDGGNAVRVSDRGPGISQKDQAFQFGISGASPEAAEIIRGVGAGLGMARAAVEKVGGTLTVEDNIGGGTVATVAIGAIDGRKRDVDTAASVEAPPPRRYPDAVPRMNISERQQRVLITVLEYGEVGPSTVAERLEISVSTAYRDLSVIEEHGLVTGTESGKRSITPLGRDLVEAIIADWVK